MRSPVKRRVLHMLSVMLLPMLAACSSSGAPQVIRETVVVTSVPAAQAPTTGAPAAATAAATTEATAAATTAALGSGTAAPAPTEAVAQTPSAVAGGAFKTLSPTLGDVRVRQGIAYCTNRLELIKARYPFLSEQQRNDLLMDSFLPRGHWALSDDITKYPYDPAKGNALLDEAGWKVAEGETLGQGAIRANTDGTPLAIKYLAADTQTSQNLGAVLEQQLKNDCGIQIIRTHAPGSYFLGARTGVQVRDFELTVYSWVGQPDPGGETLYACNQIPFPDNNWEGQNTMGWCNETASKAIIAANNTLEREKRKEDFAIFQREFTKDMVSLPLYQTFDAVAASNNVLNFKADPTETIFGNADQWALKDGGDSLVIALQSEPDTLWTLIAAEITASDVSGRLLGATSVTSYNYDYQPVSLKQLPTIENGGATNSDIDVKEGDKVWGANGEAVELKSGVSVVNAAGETVTYDGGPLKMKQLKVTFEDVPGIKWEDGQPLSKADYELGYKINCDPDSGSVSLQLCESYQKVDFTSDTSYTITYLPGAQWPNYSVYSLGYYPAHQVLSDGRKLADVPVKEWAALPEIAEKPLSTGPYKIVEWTKGQKLVFEANPNYYKGEPKIKHLTLQIIPDTTQAVAQLLTGNVDMIDYAGTEMETVIKAGQEGKLNVISGPSATWAHMDMNLYKP